MKKKAKRKLVRVTAEDIAFGRPCAAGNCPLARALSRAFGADVSVSYTDWGFRQGESYSTPPRAAEFARDFDNGEPVKPFSFYVTL